MLDNWQLAVLPQSGGTEFQPHWVHDNLMVPVWVYIRLPVQSININSPHMYITRARAKCKSKTHRYWNWRMCLPNGWSVVQGRIGHVIGIVFFYTISTAFYERTGRLADGSVATVWRYWVRSPLGLRSFIGSFMGLYAFSLYQSITIEPTVSYITKDRAKFQIITHRCWNWHLCIPDVLS